MFNQKRISFIVLCTIAVFALTQCTTVTPVPYVWPTPVSTLAPVPAPTPTPWVKQDILIKILDEKHPYIHVWIDTPKRDIVKVVAVEGVVSATLMNHDRMIAVYIDPRFSKVLVAKEIEDRLRLTSATLPAKSERE